MTATTAWAIKAPGGYILLDTIRITEVACIENKILAPWEMYTERGYRCVRVRVEEIENV